MKANTAFLPNQRIQIDMQGAFGVNYARHSLAWAWTELVGGRFAQHVSRCTQPTVLHLLQAFSVCNMFRRDVQGE